jgi:hypothetical protein
VLGLQEQRQNVVVLAQPGVRAAERDLLVDERVEGVARALEASHRAEAAKAAPQPREEDDCVASKRELVYQPLGERESLGIADAENGTQDHVEGDPLAARAKRERLRHGPGFHLLVGGLAHQFAVAANTVTVERREQELALAHVLFAVQRQHRVEADGWLQHERVGFPGVETPRVAREDLLHELGVG